MNDPVVSAGEEKYETYSSYIRGTKRVQYDYRALNGKLFTCTGATVEECRAKKDAWLSKNA